MTDPNPRPLLRDVKIATHVQCLGSGRRPISVEEAVRRWVRCTHCGRVLRIRPSRNGEATLPRHMARR